MQLMAKMAEQMELFEPVERGFNEGGDTSSAKDAAMQDLQSSAADKTAARKDQFNKLTNMLMSGEIKELPEEEQQKFIKLYKMMKSQGFNDGGLMDEGGTIDPISGNDVPPGSTQEEVRDDIPAQLSEGEFVVPADVVRYVGLENLMRMRQEAKQGLAQMEAMGQMGNSEEATVEDDLPFDMYDLDVEDNSLTMQQGGFVNPQTGTYQMPGTGITGFQQAPISTTGFNPNQPIQPYFKPTQFTQAQYQDPLQITNIPTFGDTVGSGFGQYDEMKTFINSAGQIMRIPFKDGKPIYPIPEGYSEQDTTKAEETAPTTITPTTGQTQVSDTGDDRGEDKTSPTTSTTLGKVGASLFGPSTAYNKAKAKLGAYQLSIGPTAALGSTVLGIASPKTKALMGNLARNSAIDNFGFNTLDDATPDQLDAIGYTMDAAMNLSVQNTSLLQALQSKIGFKNYNLKTDFKAGAPTAASISKSAATISDSLIGAYKDGDLSLEDLKNISEVEIDSESGAWKDPKAVKDYVDAVLSQELKDIEAGVIGTSKESGLTAKEKRDRRSEEVKEGIRQGTYGFDKDDPSDTGGSVDIGDGKTSTGTSGTGGLGPGGMGGTQESSSKGKDSYGDKGDSATGASSPSDRGRQKKAVAAGVNVAVLRVLVVQVMHKAV